MCACVSVCNRPQVREECPNYEVVVFQPQTVTPTQLGSVAYCYIFKLGISPHLFLTLSVSLFYLLLSTASPSVAVHLLRPLFFTRSPPPLPARSAAQMDVAYTHLPPSSAACTCAARTCTARTCALRRVPAYSAVSRDGALPPFSPLAWTQVPDSPWGVCPLRFLTLLYSPASTSLSSPLRNMPGCLHSFEVAPTGLSPPATWTCRTHS